MSQSRPAAPLSPSARSHLGSPQLALTLDGPPSTGDLGGFSAGLASEDHDGSAAHLAQRLFARAHPDHCRPCHIACLPSRPCPVAPSRTARLLGSPSRHCCSMGSCRSSPQRRGGAGRGSRGDLLGRRRGDRRSRETRRRLLRGRGAPEATGSPCCPPSPYGNPYRRRSGSHPCISSAVLATRGSLPGDRRSTWLTQPSRAPPLAG